MDRHLGVQEFEAVRFSRQLEHEGDDKGVRHKHWPLYPKEISLAQVSVSG